MLLIVAAGWQGYKEYQRQTVEHAADASAPAYAPAVQDAQASPAQEFRCDGRTHCSQMTSCAEATYFLRNCPDTKMDGDHDGIPCEQEWCGR
jgi:predicted negative regulator of RcsB-dependent stress response